MTTNAKHPTIDGTPREDGVHETATLRVIEPAIERSEVDSAGRVGAVAYPYRTFRASATMSRPFMDDRVSEYVVTIDRSRRIALRADTYPDPVERTVDDLMRLPIEVGDEQCLEMARDAIFKWTLRSVGMRSAPDISVDDPIDVYKLFWIADRQDGDVLIDSVRGTTRRLDD